MFCLQVGADVSLVMFWDCLEAPCFRVLGCDQAGILAPCSMFCLQVGADVSLVVFWACLECSLTLGCSLRVEPVRGTQAMRGVHFALMPYSIFSSRLQPRARDFLA